MSPCMASHLPPPENAGGGAAATASSTARIVPRTCAGQPSRKSAPGTEPSAVAQKMTSHVIAAAYEPARPLSMPSGGYAARLPFDDLRGRRLISAGLLGREQASDAGGVASPAPRELGLRHAGVLAHLVQRADDGIDLLDLAPGSLVLRAGVLVRKPVLAALSVVTGVESLGHDRRPTSVAS